VPRSSVLGTRAPPAKSSTHGFRVRNPWHPAVGHQRPCVSVFFAYRGRPYDFGHGLLHASPMPLSFTRSSSVGLGEPLPSGLGQIKVKEVQLGMTVAVLPSESPDGMHSRLFGARIDGEIQEAQSEVETPEGRAP
jgi:hypothetical protein